MCRDDKGISSFVIKCFGITNTSVQNFAIQISSGKTVPKCLRKLIFFNKFNVIGIVFIDVFTLFDSHFSKIFRKSCDIVSYPSFCTFTWHDMRRCTYSVTLKCYDTRLAVPRFFFLSNSAFQECWRGTSWWVDSRPPWKQRYTVSYNTYSDKFIFAIYFIQNQIFSKYHLNVISISILLK